MIQHTLDINLN